ncbi:MAG: hypothetical protein Q9190_002563 [Brigantiaea leucoxantha]
MKRLRYSLFESHLRKTIDNLEAWHAIFDPSWFLITLHSDKEIDTTLKKYQESHQNITAVIDMRMAIRKNQYEMKRSGSIFLNKDFVSHQRDILPYSNLALSTLSGSNNKVIIDTTSYPQNSDKKKAAHHIRDLARTLSYSQPSTLGLLHCLGVLEVLESDGQISQFQYVFSMPSEPMSCPASLRAMILGGPTTLDAKFIIAKSLVRGISAVHSADFVHKNIRPDTILIFNSFETRNLKAYLVGFERSRPAAADTSLTGDMIWERNLYRHPGRQGAKPEEAYSMQHDIYSLGICLLEIGLWNSFVEPSNPVKPGKLLHIDKQLEMTNPLKAAWEIKTILINLAKTSLPTLVGLLYTDIVLSCLTCLDSDATNMFASEKDLYDEDGILVGVVFIEKILSRLHSLSI